MFPFFLFQFGKAGSNQICLPGWMVKGDNRVIERQVTFGQVQIINSRRGQTLDEMAQVIAEIADRPTHQGNASRMGIQGVEFQ
ncbi:hypothetical protein ES703_123207 [subsurface metagenome]